MVHTGLRSALCIPLIHGQFEQHGRAQNDSLLLVSSCKDLDIVTYSSSHVVRCLLARVLLESLEYNRAIDSIAWCELFGV